MASRIEFEDGQNRTHLASHKVSPEEVEELLNNDPLDLGYETIVESPDEFSVAIRNEVMVARALASGETKAK